MGAVLQAVKAEAVLVVSVRQAPARMEMITPVAAAVVLVIMVVMAARASSLCGTGYLLRLRQRPLPMLN